MREYYENEWFPKANAMGVTWWQFWELNPHIIKCIAKGYKEQIVEQDSLMHSWWGVYGISALQTVLSHMIDKNSTAEYVKEPILISNTEKENAPALTEEEKRRQTEQLFMRLKIMGANHKFNKKDSKDK